jgi:hypothetical protein
MRVAYGVPIKVAIDILNLAPLLVMGGAGTKRRFDPCLPIQTIILG